MPPDGEEVASLPEDSRSPLKVAVETFDPAAADTLLGECDCCCCTICCRRVNTPSRNQRKIFERYNITSL